MPKPKYRPRKINDERVLRMVIARKHIAAAKLEKRARQLRQEARDLEEAS